jgi:glycosyltransferase involved in cell wall biosynthesis
MRIILSSPYCWPDVVRGGERYVHELGSALMRTGHDVLIVSAAEKASRSQVLGVPVVRLRRRRLSHYRELAEEVGFGAQALAAIGWRRYDVWHATGTSDAAAAAALGRRKSGRTVFTDHGFPAARSRQARTDRRLFREVVRHIDEYVCVSAAAAGYLTRDFGRDATVIPPGVELDAYRPGRRHPQPTLLYAGSLTESRKGLHLLAETVRRMRVSLPQLRFEVYGPGTAPASVLEMADICRPASSSELAERYALAWATVLPSTAESFGMVITESLASGTPGVVLSGGGGPTEIVTPETGVISFGTPEHLAEGCLKAFELAGDPSTAEACRSRAEQFDWQRAIVPQFEALYAAA